MKAIYKQHEGFEHLNEHFNKYNLPVSTRNDRREIVEDTSTKKYPNNKYYQFNDENSSGRKFLKQKLNLDPNYQDEEGIYNYPKSICIQKANRSMKQQFHNSLIEDFSSKYHKPKSSSKLCKTTKGRISNKSASHSKYKTKKASAHISTTESRPKYQGINSSRNHLQSNQSELKHYKKLCLDMRKKNCELTKELHECKEQNRKSLSQLQKKVDKLSEKYILKKENKENMDQNKTEKILESLKAIKGKLSKKQTGQIREEKKFYDFFTQSLGILQPESSECLKYSPLEVQVIWKQMLQFLVAHSYKLEPPSKIKTIR